MERIGERLRKRREELGFTVEDVATVIRFRPETIRAVEEGRTGVFPAEAYLKAFLRAYANTLGLDADEIVREQKSEEERIREAIKGIGLRPRRSLNVPRRVVWIAVAAAVAIAALVVFEWVLKDKLMPGGGVMSGGEELRREDGRGESPGATGVDSTTAEGRRGWDPDPAGPSPDAAGATGDSSGGRDPDATGDDAVPTEERRGWNPDATDTISRLEVSVSGWPIRARLRTGDSVLVEGWLRPGYIDTFYCGRPVVVDYLTDVDAVKFTLDGEPVKLPTSKDKRISDFEIPPAR